MNEERYYEEYEKLREVSKEITQWYDIDKVKPYSVYIWTNGENSDNVFDIDADEIVYYDYEGNRHTIIEEAKPTIKKIQKQLKVLDDIARSTV